MLHHVLGRILSFRLPPRLVFANPPSTFLPSQSVLEPNAAPWDQGAFALDMAARENAAILDHIVFLQDMDAEVSRMLSGPDDGRRNGLVQLSYALLSERSRMNEFRARAWHEQMNSFASSSRNTEAISSSQPINYDPGMCLSVYVFYKALMIDSLVPLFRDSWDDARLPFYAKFVVVTLNSVFKLSFKGCRLVLQALKTIVRLAHAEFLRDSCSSNLDAIVRAIPSNLTTARQSFLFDPVYTEYACCPMCFTLYPPRESTSFPDPTCRDGGQHTTTHPFNELPADMYSVPPLPTKSLPYPEQCTFRETSQSPPCGAQLLRYGEHPRPIRVYSYQSFISWLARFLCRPEIEPYLDASQAAAGLSRGDSVDDILFSQEILNFPSPDGRPFLRVCGTEGRYLFSLFVDWFHPRGNRQGGATYSAGVIFMVCLNLPPAIRYQRENIYLAGVIPGPKAPTLQEVNHFVEPLAFEMRNLWFKGAYFSRTALRADGRLARCAAVPLICDLGAGRKVSGHASHSSPFFCSFCQLPKDRINQLDMASWPRRDCQQFRHLAEEWRAASTCKSREALFKESGVRYSPLLLLPYWRPTRYVVVDTMHNLFLGLFQRHCRRIFGMSINITSHDGTDDVEGPDPVVPEELEITRHAAARCYTAVSLKNKFNLRLLRPLYAELGLGPPGQKTKKELSEAIIQVNTHPLDL